MDDAKGGSTTDQCDWRSLNDRLVATLKPYAPPIAISFLTESQAAPMARLDDGYPEPNTSGRTGQVPAGCVFWVRGARESFATTAADHANCSVGSLTHGFLTLEEAATKDDVGAVLESGWVDATAVEQIPVVTTRPGTVVYGPLAETRVEPDVVLLRINGLALMILKDAFPDLLIEGKTPMPHHRHRQGAGGCGCQRRMCAQPFADRDEGRRDDLRYPSPAAE